MGLLFSTSLYRISGILKSTDFDSFILLFWMSLKGVVKEDLNYLWLLLFLFVKLDNI